MAEKCLEGTLIELRSAKRVELAIPQVGSGKDGADGSSTVTMSPTSKAVTLGSGELVPITYFDFDHDSVLTHTSRGLTPSTDQADTAIIFTVATTPDSFKRISDLRKTATNYPIQQYEWTFKYVSKDGTPKTATMNGKMIRVTSKKNDGNDANPADVHCHIRVLD